jgi:integrase/recombinase XerD
MKSNRHGQAAILSDVDYTKIRRHLKSDTHKLFFDIAKWTGERWGAIAQLQVGDVYSDPVLSLPHEQITFRASTRKASPKGERSTRQVPVHPQLRDVLMAYNPAIQPSAYLFPSPLGEQPITFSAADKWFRAAVAQAGLRHKGFSTHSTRRTLITNLSQKGIGLKVIQAVTGHRDLKSLLRYIEVSPEQVKEAIAVL